MNRVRKIAKKLLSQRFIETIRFYKRFPVQEKNKLYHFIDNETYDYLKSYPHFQIGEVRLLNKKVKFSHATSFIHSIEELFCEKVYAFKSNNPEPYIIDCGANIGLSIIFFKNIYPNASILAFEPDKGIFGLLEENIKSFGYKNVTLLNNAVWDKNEELSFFSEGALAGSLTTDYWNTNNKTIVTAVDLLPYINRQIDFLKIDIEGAEVIVIKHIAKRLSFVKNMFVEYHSEIARPQELGSLLSIITDCGFRYYIKEAVSISNTPLVHEYKKPYDLQLNIFCYR